MVIKTRSIYSQAALDLKAGKIIWEEYGPALRKECEATVRRMIREETAKMRKEVAKTRRTKGR